MLAQRPWLPDLENPAEAVVLSWPDAAALGLRVDGDPENEVLAHPELRQLAHPCDVGFIGKGNRIYVGNDCGWRGALLFEGDGGSAFIMGGQSIAAFSGTVYAGGTLVWGARTNSFDVRLWVHGARTLTIGEDGLFSEHITIRTSDHHSIIDLSTGLPTNPPTDVTIGRHVWVGPETSILKGAQIGDGSIIGCGSIVGRAVPARELWAGAPARRIRKNVSWVGSLPADPHHVATLKQMGIATEAYPRRRTWLERLRGLVTTAKSSA